MTVIDQIFYKVAEIAIPHLNQYNNFKFLNYSIFNLNQ